MKRIVSKPNTTAAIGGRSPQRSRRRGTAQIELALFLPLYASILMVLPTLSSFVRTHQSVVVNARHNAWLKQSDHGDATEQLDHTPSDADVIGKVLMGQQDPSAGVVSGRDEGKASVYLKALNVAVDARSEHYLFTDPWDYRVLDFEEQHDHPRLMMGERVTFAGEINRGAFAALASTAGAAAQDASRQLVRIGNQHRKAQEEAAKAVKEVNRLIDRAEDQVDRIQDKLKAAENQVPVDVTLVDSLNRGLRTAQQELQKLKGHLQKLETMNSALRSVL